MRAYGLIGYPLSHSFSKRYFDEKFKAAGWEDCVFYNFPISTIDEIKQVLADHPHLKGFAVTIPYKKKIIRFLDEGTDAVKQMVACNCVKIIDGRLYGYNTDVTGFEQSFIKQLQPHHTHALILGTGGAAESVAYVLRYLGISYFFVSRNKENKAGTISYKSLDEDIMARHTIVINASPVGTFPNSDEFPDIPYEYLTPQHYLFDLVYNPPQTRFLLKGMARGAITCNGYEMLTIQAEENWIIWNKD